MNHARRFKIRCGGASVRWPTPSNDSFLALVSFKKRQDHLDSVIIGKERLDEDDNEREDHKFGLETKFLMLRNFSGRDSADRGTATPYFDRDSPISQLILYINYPPPTAAPTVLQINLNITAGTLSFRSER